MTKLSVRKILTFIVILFIFWNLIWLLITTFKYHHFVEVIPKNKWGLHMKKEDGYLYSVKKPDYLSFTGNLAISTKDNQELLLIWPLVSGGYEYGFKLQKDGDAFEIYIDDKLNPINKKDQFALQKVNDYKSDLENLLTKAKNMWQLK